MKNNRLSYLSVLLMVFLASVSSLKASISSVAAGGDWSNSATWSGGTVPTTGSTVILVSTNPITIDSNEGSINNFVMGNATTPATLDILSGGSLVATGTGNVVGRTGTSSVVATFNMSGGALTVQTGGLSIAGTAGTVQSTATATISGGAYLGGLAIGTTSTLSTGELIVSGAAATIASYSSSDTLVTHASGTLDFVLNGSGSVTTLNYANNTVTLGGGTLDIDVSGYTGGTETLNLIDYSTLTGSFTTVALVGTGANNYQLTTATNGGVFQAVLTQNSVPEPQTWVLVFMGMAGLVAVVRRKAAI